VITFVVAALAHPAAASIKQGSRPWSRVFANLSLLMEIIILPILEFH
jgi:hypothetical protein